LAAECLALLAAGPGTAGAAITRAAMTGADVEVADVRGPGHGLPSAEGAAAAAQAVRTEGLMTDPVYTAKALSLVARQPGAGGGGFRAPRRLAGRGRRAAGGGPGTAAAPAGPRPPAGPPPGPRSAGPPSGPPSAELIAAGFALENADAPVLHQGINLADLA